MEVEEEAELGEQVVLDVRYLVVLEHQQHLFLVQPHNLFIYQIHQLLEQLHLELSLEAEVELIV